MPPGKQGYGNKKSTLHSVDFFHVTVSASGTESEGLAHVVGGFQLQAECHQ